MADAIRLGSLGLLAALASCLGAGDGERTRPALRLEPCRLAAPGSPSRLSARCGAWNVPEDPSRPEGRRIDLRVAVVPAVSRRPAPDPLVFLTGGPGQAATESYVTLAPAFRRIHRERDVVLVDQRGTGGSNALRCPEGDLERMALLQDHEVAPWIARCLEGLDADPRFYTTPIAVSDLDAVREALGYEKVSLYGLSYGTRVALTYLKTFPERVRAVVLDGVVPQSEVLGLDVAKDAERALRLLIARCGSEPSCRDAFPRLERDLDELMARLGEPQPVVLPHPRTGRQETLRLERDMAAYAIRLLSYSQETASLIPILLRAAAEGDLKPLAAQYLLTASQVEETMAVGMGLSVLCSEDFPFFDEEEIEERTRNTYLGTLQSDHLKLVCPLWPRGEIPSGFKAPVASDVPTLLLSGEADPVTPPDNGELVRSHLGNALHLVAPGQGHVVIHRGCLPALAASFLQQGAFGDLDPSCVEKMKPWSFFSSFAGPSP